MRSQAKAILPIAKDRSGQLVSWNVMETIGLRMWRVSDPFDAIVLTPRLEELLVQEEFAFEDAVEVSSAPEEFDGDVMLLIDGTSALSMTLLPSNHTISLAPGFAFIVALNCKYSITLSHPETYKRIVRNRSVTASLPSQLSKGPNGIPFILTNGADALASYPHGRCANGMYYISGTSSRRPDNTHVGVAIANDGIELNIREQTMAVLENMKRILSMKGLSMRHLVQTTVFLVDFQDYKGMNEIWNYYFDTLSAPTRTTVAVAQLPHPNLLIEIQSIAALD